MIGDPTTSTLRFYDSNADRYFQATSQLEMTEVYTRFLSVLKPKARILDAGCGSGRDTRFFLNRGYEVEAIDGSRALAAKATLYTGHPCRTLLFQDMTFNAEFDGIWACASLLHVSRTEIGDVLEKLDRALKCGGVIYASFIEGDGERVQDDGRYFSFYNADSLRKLFATFRNLSEIGYWKSDEVRPQNKPAPWLNFLLKRTK